MNLAWWSVLALLRNVVAPLCAIAATVYGLVWLTRSVRKGRA